MTSQIHNLKNVTKHIEKVVTDADKKALILEELAAIELLTNDVHRVLDLIPTGIIIVNSEAESILLNRYAQDVLNDKDGLYLSQNRVTAAQANTMRELKDAVEDATNTDIARSSVLNVRRPSGAQSLMILVAPVGDGSSVIFLADPERRPPVEKSFVANLFGLTRMESAVAASVAQGQRLNEVAENLNISLHTARSHLKHVFSKTGTDRQLELAYQIGALLGKVWLDDDQRKPNIVPLSNRERRRTNAHRMN